MLEDDETLGCVANVMVLAALLLAGLYVFLCITLRTPGDIAAAMDRKQPHENLHVFILPPERRERGAQRLHRRVCAAVRLLFINIIRTLMGAASSSGLAQVTASSTAMVPYSAPHQAAIPTFKKYKSIGWIPPTQAAIDMGASSYEVPGEYHYPSSTALTLYEKEPPALFRIGSTNLVRLRAAQQLERFDENLSRALVAIPLDKLHNKFIITKADLDEIAPKVGADITKLLDEFANVQEEAGVWDRRLEAASNTAWVIANGEHGNFKYGYVSEKHATQHYEKFAYPAGTIPGNVQNFDIFREKSFAKDAIVQSIWKQVEYELEAAVILGEKVHPYGKVNTVARIFEETFRIPNIVYASRRTDLSADEKRKLQDDNETKFKVLLESAKKEVYEKAREWKPSFLETIQSALVGGVTFSSVDIRPKSMLDLLLGLAAAALLAEVPFILFRRGQEFIALRIGLVA